MHKISYKRPQCDPAINSQVFRQERTKEICLQKYLYTNLYHILIHNNQKAGEWKTGEWTNQQWHIHIIKYHFMIFANKLLVLGTMLKNLKTFWVKEVLHRRCVLRVECSNLYIVDKIQNCGGWGHCSMVKHMISMCEALDSITSTRKKSELWLPVGKVCAASFCREEVKRTSG